MEVAFCARAEWLESHMEMWEDIFMLKRHRFDLHLSLQIEAFTLALTRQRPVEAHSQQRVIGGKRRAKRWTKKRRNDQKVGLFGFEMFGSSSEVRDKGPKNAEPSELTANNHHVHYISPSFITALSFFVSCICLFPESTAALPYTRTFYLTRPQK